MKEKKNDMKKAMSVWCYRTTVVLLMLALLTGCSTRRSAGINKAISDIESMEEIADKYNLYNLSDYEGIALISLGKWALWYIGPAGMGWSASIYVKDPVTNEFGPPSFVSAGGISAGLAMIGVNAVDCLILFKNRDDAVNFAKRNVNFNLTSEASWLFWGYKIMTIPGGESYSDALGAAIGLIELELLFGGPRDTLHENMYGKDATVDKILLGDVIIPDDLNATLERLNLLMKR